MQKLSNRAKTNKKGHSFVLVIFLPRDPNWADFYESLTPKTGASGSPVFPGHVRDPLRCFSRRARKELRFEGCWSDVGLTVPEIWPFSWTLLFFGRMSKFDSGALPVFVFVFVWANLYLYLCICICIWSRLTFVLVHFWWKPIPEIKAGFAWILSDGAGPGYLTQERSVQKWFRGCQIEDFWCATPTNLRLRA